MTILSDEPTTHQEPNPQPAEAAGAVELSVVIPCLNEVETVGTCIRKARRAMEEHGIRGEVILADNGSTDGSIDLAIQQGARVEHVAQRGYGNALMGGIAAARGTYVLMGDADDSYDFGEIPRFIEKLREGNQLVQGCRLPSGGGTIAPGAMPFSHRWIGNPLFSWMARVMFRSPIHDIYCGMRGFRKDWYDQLNMRCTGMEFATEMIVKASLFPTQVAEVPITLHPDGRVSRRPHLRTFRDGWRTLRFLLMCSPRWLFVYPGLLLILLGVIGYGLALPGLTVMGATLDAHTLLFASLFLLMGYQSILFGGFARSFAISEGLLPPNQRLERWQTLFNLDRSLLVGVTAMLGGGVLLALAVRQWWLADFGDLDYAQTMRLVIPGVTMMTLGFQTVLASFFLGILGLRRK
jgi:glycosyltransferase involved in cell wall biosynthesis